MKLKEARSLFNEIRKQDGRISVKPHAWRDHPERKFTPLELVRLIKGKGQIHDNKYPTAAVGSFLWVCKDDDMRRTEVSVVLERDKYGDLIVIIHAYREVKNENSNGK